MMTILEHNYERQAQQQQKIWSAFISSYDQAMKL